MGVEREAYATPRAVGSAVVSRVTRHAAGAWSVEFDLDFRIMLDDGREVIVRKSVRSAATEQRGRKPRKAA